MEFESEIPLSSKECTSRAEFERNLSQTKNNYLNVTVQGHTILNEIYEGGKFIRYSDLHNGIDEIMLINDVEFLNTVESGEVTNLQLVGGDAYTNLNNKIGSKYVK